MTLSTVACLSPSRAGALLAGLLLCVAAAQASGPAAPGPAKTAKRLPADKPAAAAPAAVDETPAAPADPLDHLRQRLADRLSAARTSVAGGPYDVRVSARSTAPLAAPAAHGAAGGHKAGAKAGARAVTGHGTKGSGTHAAHWDYQGGSGPETWGALKPEFSLCKSGQRQSPIDIRGGLSVDLEPVAFDYQASKFAVLDNGHTVQVELAKGNTIDVGGKRFELQQFHFHRPSEERIDGRQFEMSLHLVHKDEQGRLAVVALLFDKGPSHPVLQQVWNNLPLERGEANPARTPLELSALLPADRRYYTYMGSLTTPPCSEGVQWIVMRHPVTLAPEQIEIFARLYPMNARPLQSASGRRILQSN